MRYPHCQQEHPDVAKFCPVTGQAIPERPASPPGRQFPPPQYRPTQPPQPVPPPVHRGQPYAQGRPAQPAARRSNLDIIALVAVLGLMLLAVIGLVAWRLLADLVANKQQKTAATAALVLATEAPPAPTEAPFLATEAPFFAATEAPTAPPVVPTATLAAPAGVPTVVARKPASQPTDPPPAPQVWDFAACQSQPCSEGNATRTFPEAARKIYLHWRFKNIPSGAHYVRRWTMDGNEWVRYDCTWSGAETGSADIDLTEPDGLHSGTWEVTITVDGVELLREQVVVEGNWNFWTPAGVFGTCYGKK